MIQDISEGGDFGVELGPLHCQGQFLGFLKQFRVLLCKFNPCLPCLLVAHPGKGRPFEGIQDDSFALL